MNEAENINKQQGNALEWWNNDNLNPAEKAYLLYKYKSKEYGKFTNRISNNEVFRLWKLVHT